MIIDKLKITTQQGKIVDASAPVIISASRSTDILFRLVHKSITGGICCMEKSIQPTAHVYFFPKHESDCVLDEKP